MGLLFYMRLCVYFERNGVRIYGAEQKLGGATLTFHVKYFFRRKPYGF